MLRIMANGTSQEMGTAWNYRLPLKVFRMLKTVSDCRSSISANHCRVYFLQFTTPQTTSMSHKNLQSCCQLDQKSIHFTVFHCRSNITRQEIVGSRIMAATVQHQNGLYGSVDLGEESVTLIFRNTYSGSSPKCVFWNMQGMSQPFWDSSGCSLITGNDTHTVCKCSHLTNFAGRNAYAFHVVSL